MTNFIIGVVHGGMLILILTMYIMSRFEDRLFLQILDHYIEDGMDQESIVLMIMRATNEILRDRYAVFNGKEYLSLRDTFFRSCDVDLLDAKGACGSYVMVMAKLLDIAGIKFRIAQMLSESNQVCHIFIEVKAGKDYIVFDPIYNLCFRDERGELVGVSEINKHWDQYKMQCPANYNPMYRYYGVKYTNWEKIPVLTPLLRMLLKVILDEKLNTVSLRAYFINKYRVYMYMLLFVYAVIAVLTVAVNA